MPLALLLSGCGLLLEATPVADAGAPGLDASSPAPEADAGSPADAGVDDQDAGREARCGDGVVSGDEDCDDGNRVEGDGCDDDCTWSCLDASDCEDGDPCTIEACGEDHRCVSTRVSCPAPDPCSVFVGCAEDGGCEYELVDEDSDGHASWLLGECGGDCDDRDDAIGPHAAEVCDGVDQDCDLAIDEGVGRRCGEDADGDGYGSTTASRVICDGAECPDGFVADASDCWDAVGSFFPPPSVANPAQRNWFTEPRGDGSGSFDWSCDGVEEPQATDLFVACDPSAGPCAPQGGWEHAVAPCGVRAEFVYCQTDAMLGCRAVAGMRTQACR